MGLGAKECARFCQSRLSLHGFWWHHSQFQEVLLLSSASTSTPPCAARFNTVLARHSLSGRFLPGLASH